MTQPSERRNKAETRFTQMMNDRRDYVDWWRKLSDMYAPNRGRFSVEELPRKQIVRLNSRARQIPDDFAAGMKSGLTSPSRPWFTLTLYDNGLAELENVKAWLTGVQDVMQGLMLRSNLYDQLFDVYKEQGIFGTGALLIEEDDDDVFHAQSLTVGSYAIGVDKRGKVNRFCRQFRRTVHQLAEEFGENALPQELKQRLKEKPDNTRYELRNLIEPSEGYLRDDMSGRFRYVSYWWLRGYSEPEFLRVGGYNEFPVMVPRWRVINDDLYGREQPGDIGYDDAATLQLMELDERDALKKAIRPPVAVPESLTQGDIDDRPGGVTVYFPTMDGTRPAITPLYQVNFDHRSVAEKRLELTAHLEEIFYVNMFKMWTTDMRQGRTATEIQAREAEKMFMLGPLIERQMSELLEPMIARIYGILDRAGKFPMPPEELQDREIKIEYVSILANLQKQSAFAGIEQILTTAGMIAQLQASGGTTPEVLDKIDGDEIIDQLADMYVIPAGIVLANASNPLKPYHSETEAIAAIGKIIQTVKNNPNMKAVADWILSDFDIHFDRINNANIANFNRGMNREKNYSPMFRLQHQTGQGINSTEIENMTINADKPQLLSDIADNFTHERQNIDHDHQQPVNLDMLNVWFKAMYMQEFNAALGGYAADIRSALLRDGEGGSIQQMIKQNLGTDYWNNLIGIYNNSINDNFTQQLDAAEKLARMLIRARSTAYIAFNPSVILAQFSSYVTALPYTGWGHLLQSLNKALEGGQQFFENVYQIAPELRFSAGDPVDREYAISLNREDLSSNNRLINAALQNDYIRGGLNLYRRGIAAGYKGVQLVDNWTKSIVFDAAYSKYIDDGLSHEEAVRLANRVLRDTQPASSNREKAPITRGSYLKQLFFTQFMNSLMPIVNMTFVDTAYNITHGGWNTVKDTGSRIFAAALTLGLAGLTKDFLNGRLPSGRERADGSVDDWPSWFGNTELGGLLNTIPILNRFIDMASPFIGIRHLRQDNPITEPLERIARGIQLFGKYEGERNSEAWGQIIHGMALIGAPIPFSGIKQFMRLVGLLDDDRD